MARVRNLGPVPPRWLAAFFLVTFVAAQAVPLGPAEAADGTPVVVSEAAGRRALDVTIYNQDLALVREVRAVELPRGVAALEFRDVPAQIEPRSLLVEAAGGRSLRLLEQNYEFDLLSREKILEKYVGQPVSWIQEDGKRIEGRLLGMAAGPVFEVGGEVVFEVPGRIALPALPANLRARPTLVWRLDGGAGGRTELTASYLTGGVSWSADYVLQLDREGRRADLQSWVSLDNRCGAAFADARILLVAGDINRAPAPRPERMVMMAAAKADYAGGVTEEALYDYHLYTLPGTTTLKDAQIKQVSLFEASGIPVQRHYRLGGSPGLWQGGGRGVRGQAQVQVVYTFENREQSQLGLPLPAGVVRVYGQSESGARQLLGEDRLDHSPKDEEVELEVGAAFDVKAERVQTDYRRIGENTHETAFEITLRNHKREAIVVEVLERIGGEVRLLDRSHEPVKKTATELRFDVPVPADGQAVLSYRVQVTY